MLHAFGLHDAEAVTRLGGTRNANYCVRTPGRTLFLRLRHPDYCDPAWIRFDHDAVRFLRRRGAAVLAPIPLPGGETSLENAGRTWEAYPWVEGDSFPETDEALESLAVNLARFHAAGKAFPDTFRPGGFARGETTPGRLLEIAQRLRAECGEVARFYAGQVETAAGRLDDDTYHSLAPTLVHGDVQPANIIYSGSEVACFVDYDWLGRQPAIYDLAAALILFCARREELIDGGDIWSLSMPFVFDEVKGRRFIEAYGVGVPQEPGIRPLLMEQVRLTWSHIRLSGALKVPTGERTAFLERDVERPFKWIDNACK